MPLHCFRLDKILFLAYTDGVYIDIGHLPDSHERWLGSPPHQSLAIGVGDVQSSIDR